MADASGSKPDTRKGIQVQVLCDPQIARLLVIAVKERITDLPQLFLSSMVRATRVGICANVSERLHVERYANSARGTPFMDGVSHWVKGPGNWGVEPDGKARALNSLVIKGSIPLAPILPSTNKWLFACLKNRKLWVRVPCLVLWLWCSGSTQSCGDCGASSNLANHPS